MLALAWWCWAIIAVIVLIVLYFIAVKALSKIYRLRIRRELVDFLKAVNPDAEVVRVSEKLLRVKTGGELCEIDLEPVYRAAVDLESEDEKALAYWRCLKQHDEQAGGGQPLLSLDKLGDRVVPWLVPQGELAANWPRSPLGRTGLSVVYVLDCGERGMALTEELLADLGADVGQLHALAIENLEKEGPIPAEAIAKAVKGESASAISFGDRYSAVRILLVQQRLGEGESIAALIPNRHTLVLLPVPSEEGDWERLHEASGLPWCEVNLLDRPIRVTRDSLELF